MVTSLSSSSVDSDERNPHEPRTPNGGQAGQVQFFEFGNEVRGEMLRPRQVQVIVVVVMRLIAQTGHGCVTKVEQRYL